MSGNQLVVSTKPYISITHTQCNDISRLRCKYPSESQQTNMHRVVLGHPKRVPGTAFPECEVLNVLSTFVAWLWEGGLPYSRFTVFINVTASRES